MMRCSKLASILLLLRFGSTSPSEHATPVLNYASISRLLGVSPAHIRRLLISLTRPEKLTGPSIRDTREKLKQHHVGFITRDEIMQSWAHLSLEQRCKMFHRAHPELTISPSTLRRLYVSHRIKYKLIKRVKPETDLLHGR